MSEAGGQEGLGEAVEVGAGLDLAEPQEAAHDEQPGAERGAQGLQLEGGGVGGSGRGGEGQAIHGLGVIRVCDVFR